VFGYYGLTQSATVDQLTSLARRTFGADAQNHLRTARTKGTDVAAVTHRFVEAHAAQVSLGGAGATNNLPTVDYRGIDAATRVRGDGSAAPKLAVYRRDDGRGAVSVALRAYCRGAPLATRSRAAAVLPDLLAARIALPLGGSLQESVTAAGGRIRTAADDQGMMIVLEVPLDKVPAVITQFTTTLTFVDDLDAVARRVVQREVSRMQADRLDPRAVAIAALRTVRRGIAWPQDAPDAAIADLHKIDSALLRSVWTTCLAPRNVGIAVIGPVDEERAPAQLEAILSHWPFGNAESPASAGVDEGWPAIESIAAVPTAKYGFLLTRKRLAVDAASLEFPALVIANFLLGGSTSAALFSRLRYSEGLSYSVGSFLTPQVCDRSTVFGIYASFTPQDFTRFQTAVRGLITTPPLDAVGEAEIHQAVDSIRKDRRASIANDLVLAATLASNLVTGQTMQDAERTDKRLATLSTQDVKAALAKLLAPEGTSLVFAGDLAHN